MTEQSNYYGATARRRIEFPVLDHDRRCDVCVIGAGFTGLGAALELAHRGMNVVLLEASDVGFGASGRSGGQIASGYGTGMMAVAEMVGLEDAKRLWSFSERSKEILYGRIATHGIDCDLGEGELYAAPRKSHEEWLKSEQRFCEDTFAYEGYRWIGTLDLRQMLGGERYCAALLDLEGGHLHPLKYSLGLAEAAFAQGVHIFENSEVLSVTGGTVVTVETALGSVVADSLVLATNGYAKGLHLPPHNYIMPASSKVIATEPLSEQLAADVMKTTACVADTYFDLDYFKMTPDRRLVYGGRDLGNKGTNAQNNSVRSNMLKTFPMLSQARVEFMWEGNVAITRKRLPHIGRTDGNIYYAHGYSGQGVLLSAVASEILAEAIQGDMTRMDVFGRINHKRLPQSRLLQAPLIELALIWNRLKDLL